MSERRRTAGGPVPPEPYSRVADVNPALVQRVFDFAQRQREANIQHHGQADDLGAGLEGAKWARSAYPGTLRSTRSGLTRVSSDTAWRANSD